MPALAPPHTLSSPPAGSRLPRLAAAHYAHLMRAAGRAPRQHARVYSRCSHCAYWPGGLDRLAAPSTARKLLPRTKATKFRQTLLDDAARPPCTLPARLYTCTPCVVTAGAARAAAVAPHILHTLPTGVLFTLARGLHSQPSAAARVDFAQRAARSARETANQACTATRGASRGGGAFGRNSLPTFFASNNCVRRYI